MITADTITREQILELRTETLARWRNGERVAEQLDLEAAALHVDGGCIGTPSYWAPRITQREAKARIAQILNARAKAAK